jgi:hypothetical protein
MVYWLIASLLIAMTLAEPAGDKVTADLTKWKIPYAGTWFASSSFNSFF